MDLSNMQVAAIVDWAKSKPYIHAVRLYGSRYKGTANPDSDVDLAITIEQPKRSTMTAYATHFHFRAKWETHLERETGLKFHIQLYDQETMPHVWSYVAAGCEILYSVD
jgi:predicted nucleotidyltransferase